MKPGTAKLLFHALAAISGVALSAIVAIKADPAHFGIYFPLVAVAQGIFANWLGARIKQWSA